MANQISERRTIGARQKKMANPGTINDNQIECTETSALVGGSQPQSPQNISEAGKVVLAINDDPKTRAPTPTIEPANFIRSVFMSSFWINQIPNRCLPKPATGSQFSFYHRRCRQGMVCNFATVGKRTDHPLRIETCFGRLAYTDSQ